MDNTIHIDEKWFYIQELEDRFILLLDEEVSYDDCQSKYFVGKVMFMCCVGRPLYGPKGELVWDGKLDLWPFVEMIAAKIDSINRPAGTLEIKAVKSVNKVVMRRMLINNIIPTIKSKCPHILLKDIFIQQDNGRLHVKNEDVNFIAAATSDGFNIKLINQPSKSPNCNVLDLGFFNSIQILQSKIKTKIAEDLITAFQMEYEGMVEEIVDNVILDLQLVMTEIMIVRGHKNFKIPHIGKGKLRNQGLLPMNFTVDSILVMDCIDYMKEGGF